MCSLPCCVLYYPRSLRFANSWSTFWFCQHFVVWKWKPGPGNCHCQLSFSGQDCFMYSGVTSARSTVTDRWGPQPPGQALRATEPVFVRSFVVVYVCLCVRGTTTSSPTQGERTSLWQHVPSSSFPICYPKGRSLASVPERGLCFIVPFALVCLCSSEFCMILYIYMIKLTIKSCYLSMMIHSYRSCVAFGYGRPRATPHPLCRSYCVAFLLFDSFSRTWFSWCKWLLSISCVICILLV